MRFGYLRDIKVGQIGLESDYRGMRRDKYCGAGWFEVAN